MVEECALVRGQTTRGGCICAGVRRPDYYTYEAGAGSRSISSRKQEQDVMRQQEPDYCQILTGYKITICAHAAGQHLIQTTRRRHTGRQTTTQTTTPDYHVRVCSRTRGGSPRVYVTSAISSRRITCMQQENTAATKATKKRYKSFKT